MKVRMKVIQGYYGKYKIDENGDVWVFNVTMNGTQKPYILKLYRHKVWLSKHGEGYSTTGYTIAELMDKYFPEQDYRCRYGQPIKGYEERLWVDILNGAVFNRSGEEVPPVMDEKSERFYIQYNIHRIYVDEAVLIASNVARPSKNHTPYHLDGNTWNNSISNLEWRQTEPVKQQEPSIIALDRVTGEFVQQFTNIKEACRWSKLRPFGIIECCEGRLQRCGNWKWEYKHE